MNTTTATRAALAFFAGVLQGTPTGNFLGAKLNSLYADSTTGQAMAALQSIPGGTYIGIGATDLNVRLTGIPTTTKNLVINFTVDMVCNSFTIEVRDAKEPLKPLYVVNSAAPMEGVKMPEEISKLLMRGCKAIAYTEKELVMPARRASLMLDQPYWA